MGTAHHRENRAEYVYVGFHEKKRITVSTVTSNSNSAFRHNYYSMV
jgi:hypothetical protein